MATRRSFRKMLDQIDKFLLAGDDQALKLWNVLSALRGPDSGDYNIKESFTEVIRTAAFPATAQSGARNIPATFAYRDYKTNLGTRQEAQPSHFRSHARAAFEALGLNPDIVNEELYGKKTSSK